MLITKTLVLKTEYNRLHKGFFRKPMTFCWGEIGQVLVFKQCPHQMGRTIRNLWMFESDTTQNGGYIVHCHG